MAIILNIDSSTTVCSVAIANKAILSIKELDEGYTHAENLSLFVSEALKEAKLKIQDLDAVAISKGPGSYTGLRIGVSFAKGIAYALQKPLISINTLQSLAFGMLENITSAPDNFLLCPMIDARRMEVYTALFDKNLNYVSEIEAKIIDAESFSDHLLHSRIFFAGNGADKCKNALSNSNAIFLNDIKTSAQYMAELAEQKYQQRDFEDVAYFEPYYLKEFVAGKKSEK